MKSQLYWKVLLLIKIFVIAGSSYALPRFDMALPYPILGTQNYVKLTGDSTGELNGNWAVLQTSICIKSEYGCTAMYVDPKKNLPRSRYDLFAIWGKDPKLKSAYPYRYQLNTILTDKNVIYAAVLYSSPRKETGIMDWEVRLIDSVVRALSGHHIDKAALKNVILWQKMIFEKSVSCKDLKSTEGITL